jgi:hypothetical protein
MMRPGVAWGDFYHGLHGWRGMGVGREVVARGWLGGIFTTDSADFTDGGRMVARTAGRLHRFRLFLRRITRIFWITRMDGMGAGREVGAPGTLGGIFTTDLRGLRGLHG